jgi:DNA/RNA-binding domain of Phe-tRNA-synthetase-like protein
MRLKVDSKLKGKCQDICIGSIEANVKVSDSSSELLQLIDSECKRIENTYETKDVSSIKNINDSRLAYRSIGKDPTRYRLSSEALFRRVSKGDGLYIINNIVDINNLISLKSAYSVGTYDLDKIVGQINFTVGGEGESYKGIGKGSVNIENLPVFEDEEGKFGSTTSDSTRAMINDDSVHILMNIISFNGDKELNSNMDIAEKLLIDYAEAEMIDKIIVR